MNSRISREQIVLRRCSKTWECDSDWSTVSTSREGRRQSVGSVSASGIDVACELKLDGGAFDENIPV